MIVVTVEDRSNISRWSLLCASAFLLFVVNSPVFGWGEKAHRFISAQAVNTMPVELRSAYRGWNDFIQDHAMDPDRWRAQGKKGEHPRHFIDLDLLEGFPFAGIPQQKAAAVEKFTAEKLNKVGLLPWAIEDTFAQLVDSFKRKDWAAVKQASAVLGHYVADAHQPLHTVANYDGQLSGQRGVHKRFEISLVNRYLNKTESKPLPAEVVAEPLPYIFAFIIESYTYANCVLWGDQQSKAISKSYDRTYYDEMDERLGSVVQGQLSRAANRLGTLWYSAWVKAGKPSLPILSQAPLDGSARPNKSRVAPKQVEENTVYITRTGSKYHRGGCRHLRSSRIPTALTDAKKMGFGACSVCRPKQ